jgi:hypothetical protein
LDVSGPRLRGRLPVAERAALAVLGIAALGGLVLAAPVARAVADPAAAVAFGREAGLAAGWSVALAGAGFAVPAIGLLMLAAFALGVLAARHAPGVAPQPYLAGANVAAGGSTAFHGVRGQPVRAVSGGFYWGESHGDAAGPTDLRRLVPAAGWLAVALVLVAGLLAAVGFWGGAAADLAILGGGP